MTPSLRSGAHERVSSAARLRELCDRVADRLDASVGVGEQERRSIEGASGKLVRDHDDVDVAPDVEISARHRSGNDGCLDRDSAREPLSVLPRKREQTRSLGNSRSQRARH